MSDAAVFTNASGEWRQLWGIRGPCPEFVLLGLNLSTLSLLGSVTPSVETKSIQST